MVKVIFIIICSFTCVASYSQNNEPGPLSMDSLFRIKAKESIGKTFPAFAAKFNGHTITKDSLAGKIVFINFWFEACPPCIAELPVLNELYKKYSADENFKFISFTYESTASIVLLKKKYNIEYEVASVTTKECYHLNQNNGFPTSIILNKEGIITDLFTGGDTDRKKAQEFITSIVYKSIDDALKK
jgi:thiol-disulfide isomerase/thioredoxin